MNKGKREKGDTSSTNDEKLKRFLKTIKILFLIQITFGYFIPTLVIPCVDSFLDVGNGFHSLVHRLYARKNPNGSGTIRLHHTEDTICVPGSGFSGFWFTLGRLHALEYEHEHDRQLQNLEGTTAGSTTNRTMEYMDDKPARNLKYECYSSGCLAVVATLLNHDIESVLDIAVGAQTLWLQGILKRHEVVNHFVDGILRISREVLHHDDEYETSKKNAISVLENEALSRVNIITTGLNWDDPHSGFLKYHSRSPAHTPELKELLMQTTWIPYATGKSIWRRDEINGDYHMDGAFSVLSHPKCMAKVDLPLRADLLRYGLRPDLERSKAFYFYNLGLNEIM